MDQQAISSDLIRGHIDTIILHTLLDGDKYAQQISDAILSKSENQYSINQATLYSSLKRLENLRYVQTYWFDASDGRRKFFKITDKGEAEVDKNLSSWAFSRLIIDKLMDYSAPQTVYNPEKNNLSPEKTPEKIVYQEIKTANTDAFNVVNQTVAIEKSENVSENKDNSQQNAQINASTQVKTENTESKSATTPQEEKEINFRNILYGLIKTTTVSQTEESEKQEIDQIVEETAEKPKFNEIITASDYNSQKNNNNGKIDFGDLTLAAAKDGYKIRISSKDSAKPFGNLYSNKLRFYTVLTMFILAILETVFFATTVYKNNLNIVGAIIPAAAVFVLAVIFGAIYLSNPIKTSAKELNGDGILTSAIIVFNLLLITFALNFLFGTDFEVKVNVITYLVLPTVVYLDFVLFFVAEFFLSKMNFFHVKRR